MDYTCIKIVIISEKIGLLKAWKRRWCIGVVIVEKDTKSITKKMQKPK
jgi:hypothetical protein